VVFMLDMAGNETVLYNFTGGPNGGIPEAPVIMDSAGNLYGTAVEGGLGFGVIYRLDIAGKESTIYSFVGGADGANPYSGVIIDTAGDLYGVTTNGEPAVLYRLNQSGAYTVLYPFNGGPGPSGPDGGVVRDANGNLYGVTEYGGPPTCNGVPSCGVVYEVNTSGDITVLHAFTGGDDGGNSGPIVLDSAGNLYGPAANGTVAGGLLYKLILQ
jgi:uncharacterized repeat protein (TIGR03803 family)